MHRARAFFRVALASLSVAALGFFAASAVCAYLFTSSQSRRPIGDFAPFLPATTLTIGFSAVDGVPLAGWFTPSGNNARAVILLHGYGSTRRQMLARAGLLHRQGYAVLLYDARGHGESGGDLISLGRYETRDLLGALAFIRLQGAREIGLVGASQGGATIALSSTSLGPDVRWAVLESVYPDLRDAIDRRFRRTLGIPGWLGGMLLVPLAEWRLGLSVADMAPLDVIGRLPCPTFIMHGAADTHTLEASARELFARAPSPKRFWLVPGADHVDLYGYAKEGYEQQLLAFIATVTPFAQGPGGRSSTPPTRLFVPPVPDDIPDHVQPEDRREQVADQPERGKPK